MSGTPFDPMAFEARLDAKLDRILALLDIINGNTHAAPPSSTLDLVVEDPVLQQGAVAVDSVVVAAPPSSTTSPAAPPTAAVLPVQFHTATPLAASAPSPTKTVPATPLLSSSAAMVAFIHPLLSVKAMKGEMAINAASQANMNENQVAAPAGGAVHHLKPATKAQAAMTSALSLPLPAAIPIPPVAQPTQAGPWLLPVQSCSTKPMVRVAAIGGHLRLHVWALHGFDPCGLDSTR